MNKKEVLRKYINKCINLGFPKDIIKRKLILHGHSPDFIDELMNEPDAKAEKIISLKIIKTIILYSLVTFFLLMFFHSLIAKNQFADLIIKKDMFFIRCKNFESGSFSRILKRVSNL